MPHRRAQRPQRRFEAAGRALQHGSARSRIVDPAYAGAHRMLESGVTGPENVGLITRSSVLGIIVTGVMRVVLFLAVLGVVSGGVALAKENPAAGAFHAAAGEVGLRLFGVILWAAAITSVIGAAYTSVSFLTKYSNCPHPNSRTPHLGFAESVQDRGLLRVACGFPDQASPRSYHRLAWSLQCGSLAVHELQERRFIERF